MDQSDSFCELVRKLRHGDDTLASEMFPRYARRLIGLAHTHLDDRMKQKVDPEDVVQSVYKSFFRLLEAEQVEVLNWDNLWYLLTVMTLRKCATRAEYFTAQRRDARREVSMSPIDSGQSWRNLIDREPTPDEAVALTETVEHTISDFDPEDREVIMMSLQGHNVKEISIALKRAERSVRRLRERLRKRLEEMTLQDL